MVQLTPDQLYYKLKPLQTNCNIVPIHKSNIYNLLLQMLPQQLRLLTTTTPSQRQTSWRSAHSHPTLLNLIVTKLNNRSVPFSFYKKHFLRWCVEQLKWVLPIGLLYVAGAAIVEKLMVGHTGNLNVGGFVEQGRKVSFDDVIGIDYAKDRVSQLLDMIKYPDKYTNAGARVPRGVLLVGPPGTGKTMMARAMANTAELPFLYVTGSDFIEVYAGRGAGRVRRLFEKARDVAPSVLFIDELDSLGRRKAPRQSTNYNSRWNDTQHEHQHDEEYIQTLNALLSLMDGMDSRVGVNNRVLVMAATNRYHALDAALVRPGRFDRVVDVKLPNTDGRIQLLKHYSKKLPGVDSDVDLEQLGEDTVDMSPADIELVVNEAAISAVRFNKKKVDQDDFDQAIIQIMARGTTSTSSSGSGYDFRDKGEASPSAPSSLPNSEEVSNAMEPVDAEDEKKEEEEIERKADPGADMYNTQPH